jgi:hypothetical protein
MSDAFTYYLPPEGTTGSAADYASSFGGVQLPQAPAFDVQTQSAAPAQSFTPTETGYTPTFDFSAFEGALPSYGMPQQQASLADLPAFGATPAAAQLDTGTISPALSQAIQRGTNISPIADLLSSYGSPAGATPTGDLYAQPDQATQAKSPLDSILGKMSGGDIVKLLTGGVGGLMSYLGAQKAQQQAADAAAEYRQAAQTAAQQYRDVAAPYITAGAPQLSMALQGNLGPAQLQQYQAGQAQLAQVAAKSGGIGAIQTAAAEQALYNNALQQQQTMALQLLGQGDPYLSNAIKTELSGVQGGLDFELKYGAQAATALGQMMASLGSSVGRTA